MLARGQGRAKRRLPGFAEGIPADPFVTAVHQCAAPPLPDAAGESLERGAAAAGFCCGARFGLGVPSGAVAADAIVVGYKAFTEGYVRAEIGRAGTIEVPRKPWRVVVFVCESSHGQAPADCFGLLKQRGAIDGVLDYTGTLTEATSNRRKWKSYRTSQQALLAMIW